MQEAVTFVSDRKKIIRKAGLIFFIVILLLTFFSRTISNFLLPEVEYRKPYRGRLEWETVAKAEVRALGVEKVQASGNWKIAEIKVDEGDRVARGDILATVDSRDVLADLKKLELELQELEIDLEKFKSNFTGQELPAYEEAADKAYNVWKAAIEEHERIKALFEEGAETAKKLKDSRNALDSAEKEYQNKTALIGQKKKDYELTLKQKQIRLELAAGRMESMEESIPLGGQVVSPADGIVNSVFVEKGSVCSSGQVLMEIIGEDSPVVVQWLFNTVKADSLKEGDRVEIRADVPENILLEGRITGKKYLTEEKMYRFTASPDNGGNELQNGLEVEVRAIRKSMEYPVLLPNSAVFEVGGRKCVFVLKEWEGALGKENYVELVYVKAEDSDDFNTAITGNVNENDDVVVYSTKALTDGMQVKLR